MLLADSVGHLSSLGENNDQQNVAISPKLLRTVYCLVHPPIKRTRAAIIPVGTVVEISLLATDLVAVDHHSDMALGW